MKAVILAGGLGSRLMPYTKSLPKPMLPLGEKPIAEHLVGWTKKNGIKSIVFCVSYLRKTIEELFGDGLKIGFCRVCFFDRPYQLGALKTAQKFINIVCSMYGDSITINLKNDSIHQKKKGNSHHELLRVRHNTYGSLLLQKLVG